MSAKPVKFETAVTRARNASKSFDRANWIIGDLALTIDTSTYGSGTVQKFSDEIFIAYKTVMDMRKVASRYAAEERSDVNKWSVHQIFAGQDDRAKLVKSQVWTAAEARELVKSRKDAANGTAEGSEGSEGSESDANVDPRAKLVSEVARLTAELEKATAALALYDAEHPVAPAVVQHSIPGVPAHTADEPRTDCDICVKSGAAKKMPAPRKSRTRQPAGSAAK